MLSANASYKKLPGILQLTPSTLQWTQTGKSVPTVNVPHSEAASLFCSKEGAAQVRLKLGLIGDDNGHNFTFTSPQLTAYNERESFKKELTNIISRNRSIPPTPKSVPNAVAAAPIPTPKPIPAAIARTSAPSSRAPSLPPPPIIPGSDPTTDFRLRKKVLMATPELAALHRDLVISGQITEAEFWEGREHLLLAQTASEAQKRGKPGQLVDPRPEAVEGGEIKIVITPQLVHDIFEEYPVVAKAYNDNVPAKLTEADFWKRYFQSKLFNAHRASIRSAAAQHVVKADAIFDRYLEKDDDELEPRRQRASGVAFSVDLGATLEDHDETGNSRDITMQAGRQRGALPLIRKFNEHSERLLNSALGEEGPANKRRRLGGEDGDGEGWGQVDLDDLHEPEAMDGIVLEMQDRQRYFEGQMAAGDSTGAGDGEEGREKLNVGAVVREAKGSLVGWEARLAQLKIEKKAGDAALLAMTQNVSARLEVKTKKNDIPPSLFSQMTTCQTAANEFLRQFWSAMYPPLTDQPVLAPATPAQKAAKAAKMAGYLGKTHEKVGALVSAAHGEGVDARRVELAMKPVLDAVDRALGFYASRRR